MGERLVSDRKWKECPRPAVSSPHRGCRFPPWHWTAGQGPDCGLCWAALPFPPCYGAPCVSCFCWVLLTSFGSAEGGSLEKGGTREQF